MYLGIVADAIHSGLRGHSQYLSFEQQSHGAKMLYISEPTIMISCMFTNVTSLPRFNAWSIHGLNLKTVLAVSYDLILVMLPILFLWKFQADALTKVGISCLLGLRLL